MAGYTVGTDLKVAQHFPRAPLDFRGNKLSNSAVDHLDKVVRTLVGTPGHHRRRCFSQLKANNQGPSGDLFRGFFREVPIRSLNRMEDLSPNLAHRCGPH